MISKELKGDVRFSVVLDVIMKGTIIESITPALKTGGELTKVLLMRSKWNISGSDAVAIVCFQKVISLYPFILLCIVAFGWLVTSGQNQSENLYILIEGMLFLFIVVFISFSLAILFPHKIILYIERLPVNGVTKEKILGHMGNFRNSIGMLRPERAQMFRLTLLSFIIWALFGLKAYLLAISMDMDIGFAAVFTVTMLSYMVAMIPVSPGGLGTFEGSIMLLLIPLGISAPVGITFALVLRFATHWFALMLSMAYIGSLKVSNHFRSAATN